MITSISNFKMRSKQTYVCYSSPLLATVEVERWWGLQGEPEELEVVRHGRYWTWVETGRKVDEDRIDSLFNAWLAMNTTESERL